jgi:hypothetical protein
MFRLLAIFIALSFCGCASSRHEFAPVSKGAKTVSGQLRYSGGGRAVIGDVFISQSADGGRLEFEKGAGLSLLRVLSDKTHWRFEGPLARGAREIPRGGKVPAHLVVWQQLAERPAAAGSGSFSDGGEKIAYQLSTVR